MKECNKCLTIKPLDEYHIKSKSKDGLAATCKVCKSKLDKEYREANKSALQAKGLAYRKERREELRKKSLERYHSASEAEVQRRKELKRLYNQNASEDIKERKRLYDKQYFASEKGKDVTRRSVHKRRAQKLASEDGTVTAQALEDLKIKQSNKCFHCSELLDFSGKGTVHLDHFIPLSLGGCHTIDNVVWSCAKCNLTKSNNYPKGCIDFTHLQECSIY